MTTQHAAISPDRLTPPEAAVVLRLPYPGTFNRVRRRLQKIYDRATSGLALPPSGLTRAQERAFSREHILVVPEWGGVSWFGSDWTYSRQACEAWGAAEYCREIGVEPASVE